MLLYNKAVGFVTYPDEDEYYPIVIKTFLPGSYAIDRRTGTKIS